MSLALALTVPMPASAQGDRAAGDQATEPTVSLAELLAAAQRHHPLLEAARDDVRAAQEGIAQARSAYRPSLTLQGSISTADRDATLQDGGDFDQTISPRSASLRLDQVIYAGGRRAIDTQRAATGYRIGRASYATEEQAVFAEVIQAYVSLSLARETVRLQGEGVGLFDRRQQSIRARQRVGDASRFDLSQTRARLARAEADLASSDVRLAVAEATLASLTGTTAPPDLSAFREASALPSLAVLQRMALGESPAVESSRLRAEAARLSVASSARERLPTVSITGAATASEETSPVIDRETDLSIGLSLRMPLYQGGLVTSRTREDAAAYRSARHRADDQRRRVELQVATLYAELQGATATIRTASVGLGAARDALRGTERSQEVGLVDEIRVLDAIDDLRQAEIALVVARHEWFRSYLLLQLLTGQLDPASARAGVR